jgi:hypothetical protein
MLRRYIIFTYDQFEGCSGWHGADRSDSGQNAPPDSFDTVEQALERVQKILEKNSLADPAYHIVDLHTGLIAYEHLSE